MSSPSHTPTPIFVLGMNRSGTKWLSNRLANHPDVCAVQAEEYGGILETNLFNIIPHKFDFTSEDDYAALIALWSQTDFVRRTGVDVRPFVTLQPSLRTPAALFGALMDAYAQRRGTPFWLQKVGPDCAPYVAEQFPHARLVIILRDLLDTVHSTRQLSCNVGQPESLMSATFGYVLWEKHLRRTARRHAALVVHYEQLRRDPPGVMEQVCRHVGLPWDESLLHDSFEPNTSFSGPAAPRTPLPPSTRLGLRTLAWLLHRVPCAGLQWCSRWRPYARQIKPFVPGTFATLRRELETSDGGPGAKDARATPEDSAELSSTRQPGEAS